MKILLFLALILPLVIYVPVEVKTFQYGKDFDALLMKTDINSRAIIYYKVISISQDQAKLFVVEGENGEHQLGSYYYFTKENQQWIISETVDTLWTNLGGSATEFGFPPYF